MKTKSVKEMLWAAVICVGGVCAFGTGTARAGDMFYTTNQAGGAIVLTDSHMGCGQQLAYYSTDGGNIVIAGCWTVSDPFVVGTDMNGTQHRWLLTLFTPTEYGKQKIARARLN